MENINQSSTNSQHQHDSRAFLSRTGPLFGTRVEPARELRAWISDLALNVAFKADNDQFIDPRSTKLLDQSVRELGSLEAS